ncbi:hypothetical protein Tco_0954024, partial [Tanacetum coccineum]
SDDEASLGDQEDASKQERKIHDIDADEDITLENVHDEDIVDEVTLAQALAALKSTKVQEKGDVIKELSVPVSAASTKDMDMISMEVIRRYHSTAESSDIAVSTATYVRYRTKELFGFRMRYDLNRT